MARNVLSIMLIIFLIGCNTTDKNRLIKTETWEAIIDKEWSNFDSFPGDGFYFYEQENRAYCTYYIYGSGLPIIYENTSEVKISDEGMIEIVVSVPDEDFSENQTIRMLLKYEDGMIEYNSKIYRVEVERDKKDE